MGSKFILFTLFCYEHFLLIESMFTGYGMSTRRAHGLSRPKKDCKHKQNVILIVVIVILNYQKIQNQNNDFYFYSEMDTMQNLKLQLVSYNCRNEGHFFYSNHHTLIIWDT